MATPLKANPQKGGARKNAGRPKGRKDNATLAMEEAARRVFETFKPKNGELTSLELFQAIYRNPEFPLAARLKAASEALPYEHPKLAAIEHTGKDGGAIETRDVSETEVARRLAFLLTSGAESAITKH